MRLPHSCALSWRDTCTAAAPPAVAAAVVDAAADHARRFVMKLCPAHEDMLYSPDGATVPSVQGEAHVSSTRAGDPACLGPCLLVGC